MWDSISNTTSWIENAIPSFIKFIHERPIKEVFIKKYFNKDYLILYSVYKFEFLDLKYNNRLVKDISLFKILKILILVMHRLFI